MAAHPPSADPGQRPIRLMIVDDSLVARTVITRILEGHPQFEIVGVATRADQALALLDTVAVDIILLDVEMPGTDGLTALPELLARSRGARVLVVSSAAADGAAATVRALTLGAADTLLKPGAGNFAGRFADVLAERLIRIGHAELRPWRQGVPGPERRAPEARLECVAIGASTGGMHALSALFRALPRSFRVPILVTQHLPAVFMPYFAAQLQDIAGRTASVAADGASLRPGELLIAPGDGHLRLARTPGGVCVRIDRAPAVSGCTPSVDPMFESVARMFGPAGIGIVLSGMGRDGARGSAELVAAGGEVLAQDAESSVVWGMPGVVANAGLAAAVLPPARIAERIALRPAGAAWS